MAKRRNLLTLPISPLDWHTFTDHDRVLLQIRRAWMSIRSEVLMVETRSVFEMLTVSEPETADSPRFHYKRKNCVSNCKVFSSETGGARINREALKWR
jgi:hypothetical protein